MYEAMARLHSFTTPDKEEDIVKRFKILAKREGGMSKIITEYMKKYVQEHEESQNPQTTLTLYEQDNITACPNIYTADGTQQGDATIEKFYNSINLKDYKTLDAHFNRWFYLHNRALPKIEAKENQRRNP